MQKIATLPGMRDRNRTFGHLDTNHVVGGGSGIGVDDRRWLGGSLPIFPALTTHMTAASEVVHRKIVIIFDFCSDHRDHYDCVENFMNSLLHRLLHFGHGHLVFYYFYSCSSMCC
jgi:hypothetical protein